ncbi:AlpA family phage regulatory protein [uncultured Paraglaciecola sp.]|uniref:helix-turn-helix transcriptional regulator n=1 Tax=uncultured Paraglaciecola sp. TaxID=1765024 RepID=UPI0025F8BABF|nr:AlpA family phage regulatory protein [uncultured Paraglaciecola sp.]
MTYSTISESKKSDHLNEMLRTKQAAALLGVSLVTLWRIGERDTNFPSKIRISSRCVGYRRGDLLKWQESQMGA